MDRVKLLIAQVIRYVQQHLLMAIGAAVLLVLVVGSSTYAALHNTAKQTPQTGIITEITRQKTAKSSQAPLSNTDPTKQIKDADPAKDDKKTPATVSSAHGLKISPSSFTVKAGESPTITIQSDDGTPINMPGFSNSPGGKYLFNFPAGPAKASWTGTIFISTTATTGSNSLAIFAQDTATAYYRGSITINIVQPTMDISVQSLGYDASDDSVGYSIKINRLYGFDESITTVTGLSTTETGLGCIYAVVDSTTINLVCGALPDQPRPTSGTVNIDVKTANVSRSTTAAYNLPSL
jgi:hypothetical protein